MNKPATKNLCDLHHFRYDKRWQGGLNRLNEATRLNARCDECNRPVVRRDPWGCTGEWDLCEDCQHRLEDLCYDFKPGRGRSIYLPNFYDWLVGYFAKKGKQYKWKFYPISSGSDYDYNP